MTTRDRSPLEASRTSFLPEVPPHLQDVCRVLWSPDQGCVLPIDQAIGKLFPKLPQEGGACTLGSAPAEPAPLRVGVVLSGGPAAGGHNVLWGLQSALTQMHSKSQLIGFLKGPGGILTGETLELDQARLEPYRNQGGFDLLGSGRTKIETPEQIEQALKVCMNLRLNGLVVVGGDDSNTNAAVLAEAAAERGLPLSVVGVPKTIDGDLQNPYASISFGFDTATKIYSEAIGNLGRDALSSGKYFHFVKLMGRSASHITLECALQTQAPYALIGEEIRARNLRYEEIIQDLTEWVRSRIQAKLPFGVVLIPEGLIEFIPEFSTLIEQLNSLTVEKRALVAAAMDLSTLDQQQQSLLEHLSQEGVRLLTTLPREMARILVTVRDPHGNLQLSALPTEELLAQSVSARLRSLDEGISASFQPVPHDLGYEGRCSPPSNFDATYCYALGRAAASLVQHGWTGYMACIQNLHRPVAEWAPYAVPLLRLMHLEWRGGKQKPVIAKAFVDLEGAAFQQYVALRAAWKERGSAIQPGPLQYFGPADVTWQPPMIIQDRS